MSKTITAQGTEALAWEQLKKWKHQADMEKRTGVIKANTICNLNRAYMVLKTMQLEKERKTA